MPLTFTLGKQTYTLSDECLVRMRLAMDNTVTRERGFVLHGDFQNVMPGKERIGGKETIIPRITEVQDVIGFFHTHPDGDPELSATDWDAPIIYSAKLGIPFLLCVGANRHVYCTTVADIDKLVVPKRLPIEVLEELWQHLVKPYHFVV